MQAAALRLAGALTLALLVTTGLAGRWGGPAVGALLDPAAGLYASARAAEQPAEATLRLPALEGPVTVVRDGRWVAHVFAGSDRDAVIAMGYVVAQDRLFQLDFLPRVASGALAEVFGPELVASDRFLRRTGMDAGARRNAARAEVEGGIEHDLVTWFAAGVNARLDELRERDLPLEFRLLGYRPKRWAPLQTYRLLQYMAFDLTFGTDRAEYGPLRERLGEEAFRQLFPAYATIFSPIVPGTGAIGPNDPPPWEVPSERTEAGSARTPIDPWAPERVPGKGSNAWAVGPSRSSTGAALLANDMHLGLSLPAVFYEIHLVTPTMNVYGVTIPGAPLPIAGFTEHAAWGFTNTGADQIDHYRLRLDSTGTRYAFDGRWLDLAPEVDTIRVAGAEPVIDTLWHAHWGPLVERRPGEAVAIQWTAHHPSRTARALWGMAHARSLAEFEAALRDWDTPMQNVLVATAEGEIATRSAGHLPIRRGGTGAGLLDGSTRAGEWVERVPFSELPYARSPEQGFLFSANQPPAGPAYLHYLGHDWRDGYRSIRLDTLLRSRERHGPEDFARYQRDVRVVQRDLFVPLLDTLAGLEAPAEAVRQLLVRWDGEAALDRPEPLAFRFFLSALDRLAWDEFDGDLRPNETVLYWLLRDEPNSPWLDVRATPEREAGPDLLRRALAAAADSLARFGPSPADWRWGDHHGAVFRHLTRSEALRALWRGPFPFPGFERTLSPAAGNPTTHSAAWRMIVDFSTSPPRARGIYPGGQSGDPFSRFYDLHLADYLAFRYYDLALPRTPEEVAQPFSTMQLVPE